MNCFDEYFRMSREIRAFGFEGSMITRLKLKEIDGGVPTDVEPAA